MKSKHNGHHNQVNSFCDCGHSSGSSFHTSDPPMITKEISKNLCLINDYSLKEFIEISEIDENEAKYVVGLNQIGKLSTHSSEAVLITDYFEKSQTIGQKPVKIRNIYSIYRENQRKQFVKCGYDIQRRILLWHGTKCKNLNGILKSGFRLPSNDKLTFGDGIYFADRVTKSCDYCDQKSPGILLLCDVSVGSMYDLKVVLIVRVY